MSVYVRDPDGNKIELYASIHNNIFPPKDLAFEDGYLMFMDENQSVVS